MVFDPSSIQRSLTLTVRCPEDLGYPPWDGRELRIVADNVFSMRQEVVPVAGPESINFITRGLAARTPGADRGELPTPIGAHVACVICFHSGGSIELVATSIRVVPV